MTAGGDKRPSIPVASGAGYKGRVPARTDAGSGVGLVPGTASRYVRAHGRLVELDGMPSLTRREQDLPHRYRRFHLDRVEGRRLPETDAQRRFLEVAARRLPPETEHGRLWVRRRRMIRDRNVRTIMRRMGPDEPSSRQPVTAPQTLITVADPDAILDFGRFMVSETSHAAASHESLSSPHGSLSRTARAVQTPRRGPARPGLRSASVRPIADSCQYSVAQRSSRQSAMAGNDAG